MGSTNFATSQSSVYQSYLGWYAFDNTGAMFHSAEGKPQWLSWYNPLALTITHLELSVGNASNYPDLPNEYKIQGCNDNENWIDVYSTTNTSTAVPTILTMDFNSNNTFKYWRYLIVNMKARNFGNCKEAYITATCKI